MATAEAEEGVHDRSPGTLFEERLVVLQAL
jgi:hypothetical protein